jgi:hypothetical protein
MESLGSVDQAAGLVPAAREGTVKRFCGVLTVVAIAIVSVLAFGTARGHASLLGCSGYTYSQPFAPWGDGSSYELAPGGSFEGWNSWTLTGGAQVVSGNEPFYVNSPFDSHSLLLPPGSSATVPAICLGTLDPKARIFGKSSDGSAVHVDVYAVGLLGLVNLGVSANISLSSSWNPSGQVTLLLDNVLALSNLGTTKIVFRFSPIGSATDQLDDFYVDPILEE